MLRHHKKYHYCNLILNTGISKYLDAQHRFRFLISYYHQKKGHPDKRDDPPGFLEFSGDCISDKSGVYFQCPSESGNYRSLLFVMYDCEYYLPDGFFSELLFRLSTTFATQRCPFAGRKSM